MFIGIFIHGVPILQIFNTEILQQVGTNARQNDHEIVHLSRAIKRPPIGSQKFSRMMQSRALILR